MIKLKKVRPKDLSAEEYLRLLAANKAYKDKMDFPEMVRRVWDGTYSLYTLNGDIKGVCVLNKEPPFLNIYYLHGEGLFGKIKPLAKRLLDISRKEGLKGLSCVTKDVRKARLFRMVPGAELTHDGGHYYLELTDGRF